MQLFSIYPTRLLKCPFKALLISICSICFFSNIQAQTESQLVSLYKAALQKAADDQAFHSMRMTGEFLFQKITLPVKVYYKAPSLLRVEMSFQTLKFIQISNDSLKWEFNPMENKNDVTAIGKEQSNIKKQTNSFDYVATDLLQYKELKHDLKFLRKERVDSVDTEVLELTDNSTAAKTLYYLNIKTHLLYKIANTKGFHLFADYRNEQGFVFPFFLIESGEKQTMEAHFSHVKMNEPLPDSLFIIPKNAIDASAKTKGTLDDIFSRADKSYQNQQYDSAILLYNKALTLDPKSYRAYNSRGLSKIIQKEYYEAIADLTKATELNSQGANAFNNRGLAKYYLGDHEGATKDYTKALDIDPTLTVAFKNRGLIYLEKKDYEAGIKDFSKALEIDPKDGESHFKHGFGHAQLEKYEAGLKSYRLAILNGYKTAELFNFKGVAEFKTENYDSARVSFYQALVSQNENLQYLENYGRTLYELGEYVNALHQFDEYLKKKGDNPEILNMKGLCKYQQKDYKGSIKDFSQAIAMKENATYYDNRAASKEMTKDFKGAIEDYGESIRIYPTDASVFYKRGLLRIRISKNTEGCHDLSTANEMKYEPAKEAIKKNCR
jgi:tetratricopeptide (TPR) repeat protein